MPWYITRAGRVLGPIDTRTLQARLGAGEIASFDRLARPGDAKWLPAAHLFPEYFSAPGRRSRWLVATLALLSGLGCWLGLGGMFLIHRRLADPDLAIGLGLGIMAACAALLLSVMAALVVVRKRAQGPLGGGFKAMVGMAVLIALPALATSMMVFKNTVASDTGVDPHHLDVNEHGEVLLFGGLGRTLAHDLKTVLDGRTGELVLVLDNGGGILESAEAAATLLRQRGPFTARVDGECASACALLLAAADRIELYADSRIGLHRPSSILGGELGIDTDATIALFVERLERAGFGPRALDAVRHTPSDDMAWLEPSTHYGVLPDFQLLDAEGRPLAEDERGVALARELLGRSMPEAAEMLELIRHAFPDHAREHSERLLAARARDAGVDDALSQLLHVPFSAALAATPPAIARGWLLNLVKLDEQFEWASPAGACYDQKRHWKAERAALARAVEVVRGAADREWVPWPVPVEVAAARSGASAEGMHRRWPHAYSDEGPHAERECARMLSVARELLDTPDDQLPAALVQRLL